MNAKPKVLVSKKEWVDHLHRATGLEVPTNLSGPSVHDAWVAAGKAHLANCCSICGARLATRRWERTLKEPSVQTMERWSCDGVAKAIDGCKVEPDGHCQHGFPSWILYLGYC
jgi:hypothetical protein